MGQNRDRLEPGQTFVSSSGMQRVRVKEVKLSEAKVKLERIPTDREHPTFEMDISEFLQSFRLQ